MAPGHGEEPDTAGLEDLTFHHLRHTGAVLAAQSGATLSELLGRLGHATPAMAMIHHHAAADRDRETARHPSEMAREASASWPTAIFLS